jgi:hypothetical protein
VDDFGEDIPDSGMSCYEGSRTWLLPCRLGIQTATAKNAYIGRATCSLYNCGGGSEGVYRIQRLVHKHYLAVRVRLGEAKTIPGSQVDSEQQNGGFRYILIYTYYII